jgi:hypothetical protein
MLRLIGLPGLGFVLRPVVIALVSAAFLTGIHFEKSHQERRCLAAGGTWAGSGLCMAEAAR